MHMQHAAHMQGPTTYLHDPCCSSSLRITSEIVRLSWMNNSLCLPMHPHSVHDQVTTTHLRISMPRA